jgi:ketosteroid isomerase-like protein
VTTENFETIMRGFELWNRGEVEATLEFIEPGVEWRPGPVILDADELYEGHQGVLRFWEEFRGAFDAISVEPLEWKAQGDEVVIRCRFQARGREGVTADLQVFHRYTMRDGMLYRFQAYPSWDEALAAAGLA